MKIIHSIKKSTAVLMLLAFVASPFALSGTKLAEAAAPNWDATGSYVINMNYQDTDYPHDLSLTQDGSGNLTGNGGSPAGANTYTWVVDPGSNVSGDAIHITAHYTATEDAVVPPTTLIMDGTIAEDGTLSGTWSDNYQGSPRSGALSTENGAAVAIPPASSTVKVTIAKYMDGAAATAINANSSSFAMNASWSATNIGTGSGQYSLSPTGLNNPAPYEATTADMSSGASYSTSEMMDSTTGISCDVDNASPYSLVGYTSGDSLGAAEAASPSATPPAFTNLTNDKFVIVWNHDCNANINNANVTTNAATAITAGDATLNGTNGASVAIGHSFWASTNSFSTASSTLPSGVYSTPDMGAIEANTAFSAPLSSVVGLGAITPNTTYYFAAWSNVGGTWYPGQVLSFTTGDGTIGGTVGGTGVLKVDSIESVDTDATADGTFANGWKYIFNITVPTDETHLAMKFADWAQTGGAGTIGAANNIRISSPQADNSGATVLITAAGTYSTPDLNMITDLDPNTDGIQTKVTVEVAIPAGTTSGAYTTSYGVRSE